MRAVADLVTGRVTDGAYAAGWSLVRALPEPVAAALFTAGADLAVRRGGPAVDRLRRNLARAAPDADPDALVREGMRSYARYWREVFRLPVTSQERIDAGMELVDPQGLLLDLAASGRGLVAALPHSGNWDHAGAWLVGQGVRFTTVAERLRPESLYDRFVAFREGLGMEVLPLTGGAPPFDVLADRLRAGGTLCLLADRDLSARGVPVDLLGARTRMPAGPAALALRTGAALLPVTLSFRPDGWRAEVHDEVPPTDVPTMTQALADAFGRGIAAHPADWHMLQRLWLDDLAPDDPRRTA
ncbi:MAG TPA: phosphatidylinositol mannoside acyltransferase [Mycobacteriales bacterium]|nr:phosphatidylinositol mannoside acyltransferase [Mycobacteriales bacterium]